MERSNIPSLNYIDKTWNDEQRRIIWTLSCKARQPLQLEVDPVIATAFVILQRYFRWTDENGTQFDLLTLMVASIFDACKQADSFRTMQAIYSALFQICLSAPSPLVQSLVLDKPPDLSPEMLSCITCAEFELLKATDFDFKVDLPFSHFQCFLNILRPLIPTQQFLNRLNSGIIDICLMICSREYLDVPPEVSAIIATMDSFNDCPNVPEQTTKICQSLKEKYGPNVFIIAQKSIEFEKSRTAFHPPK